MGLDIVSNTMATDASNSLSVNEMNMQSSLQKLSSGYQINNAADDPSGLVISQHLQAQIGGFQQAQANTQSDVNVVQTADGALNEVGTILQKINTLAVEAANTSATDATAQQAAEAEVTQSLSSISNIASSTVYGDTQLLVNGTASSVNYTFQVGADNSSASQVSFSVTALNLANLGLVNNSLTLPASADGISSAVGNIASGTHSIVIGNTGYSAGVVSGTAAVTGASIVLVGASFAVGTATSFTVTVNGGTAATVTLAAGTYTLAAVDAAVTGALVTAGYAASAVTATASTTGITLTDSVGGAAGSIVIGGADPGVVGLSATTAVGTSTGATTGTYSVSLDGGATVTLTAAQAVAGGTFSLGEASGTAIEITVGSAGLSTGALTVTQAYSNLNDSSSFSVTASNAITVVQAAIQTVSSMRGQLGAYQDELQGISDNESVMTQNLQASNASIKDTNMASEMVNFTQDQVLVQAGVSMLAQANQIPQYVLKLLG
jgi:flagellin